VNRRVVITGAGLITPVGNNLESSWAAILAGQSGIGPISKFDTEGFSARIAGEVKGFDVEAFISKKDQRKMDTFIHFGVAAADMALQMSGLVIDERNDERVGVIVGSGVGGLPAIEATVKEYLEKGPRRISPFFIPMTIINMVSGHISIRTGAKGPNSAVVTACATGTHAMGEAFRIIRGGYADAMIAGGTEACICPTAVGGFAASKALSTRNDEPERASRPWDKDRDGFVMGEGAGVVVMESLESALARGANIICEVVGYGMSGDAYHMTTPAPCSDGGGRAMKAALSDANLLPSQIQYINAHGTSTPTGDTLEIEGVKGVFGDHATNGLLVSSTKSMTGHLLGAAGGIEGVFTALAIRDQIAPPTINLENPDEGCDLDFVAEGKGRPAEIHYAMSNSFGFGGTNATIVLARYNP